MPGELTWKELNEQPQAWRFVLERARGFPLPPEGGEFLFLGAGITYYLAQAMARFAELHTGRSARALPAQELFLNPGALSGQRRVFVIFSRTGDVSDAVRAIQAARREGVQGSIAVVIGERGGPLAQFADTLVECGVVESSVVTTKTFTGMALAGMEGILQASGRQVERAELRRVPDVLEGLIAGWDEAARRQVEMGFDQIVFLGTGPLCGMAEASALSACEMALLQSAGYHALVYLHGRKVIITDRTLVVFYLSDQGREDELRVVAEVRRMGARTVVIGEHLATVQTDVALELGSGVSGGARLPLYPVFAQLLGYHSAMAKGVDPDRPRELPKVF